MDSSITTVGACGGLGKSRDCCTFTRNDVSAATFTSSLLASSPHLVVDAEVVVDLAKVLLLDLDHAQVEAIVLNLSRRLLCRFPEEHAEFAEPTARRLSVWGAAARGCAKAAHPARREGASGAKHVAQLCPRGQKAGWCVCARVWFFRREGLLVQQPCVTGAWGSDHPDDQVHVLLRHERRHHQRPDASLSLRLRPTGTVRASVTAGIVCVPQLFGVRRLPFAARRRGRGPNCPAPEASKTLPGPPAPPSVRASWAGQSTGRRG